MSILPGEKLHYAETHFKFKLPWSLLYKPWPEILVDAPFQFIPGVTPKLWMVVRDAHRFPTEIQEITIRIEKESDSEEPKELKYSLGIRAEEQFAFYPVEIGNLAPGVYKVHCKITASRNGKVREFSRWNYPGLKPKPLRIHVLSEMPPKPAGFIAGEMHCHTHYSADHVEHGATPAVFQEAAKAIGLDFVSCTDHAYDFAFLTEDYTKEAPSPLPRFEALRKEIAECNSRNVWMDAGSSSIVPLMIAGEEVSVGNSKGENVHMTVLGPSGYLPGLGDCGRNWLDNKPTFRIPQVLKMTEAPCFAAHPHQQMGYLEKFVFRRGYWKSEDLQTKTAHPVRGIQFWNGLRDEGFMLGREWWIQELGKENYVLPIGGNDAHGDLNDTTAVDLPLFSLKNNRHHVFGKVRTVVQLLLSSPSVAEVPSETEVQDVRLPSAAEALSVAAVQQAFAGENCYVTDGPALWWERSYDSNGRNSGLTFHARSNPDLGGCFRYIKIFGRRRLPGGKLSPREELHLASQVATLPTVDIPVDFENYVYLRAECETATGKFALTSAAKSSN
ncbi:PHP domain-containing protein [Fibrobacter sp. UWEL]|uniref:PHP domain-containing protein n=1 Tax=Fibrobacter sp. UWEL TaxID=1896209 RepID=UPI000914C670|nr:hypothetical protein [Fibrobacter sp. UWEL]SHK89578.1 hypothetical protein SAMN05720468_10910 [Fibrobacter sp. UWEL]